MLRFFEQQSYQDIARITRQPIGTVGIRLQRALQELREILGPKLDASRSDPPPPPG